MRNEKMMYRCLTPETWLFLVISMCSLVKENQSQDVLLDGRIRLFVKMGIENIPSCGNVFLHDKDTFIIRGQVNNSGINLISVKFEKKYADSSKYELVCFVVFAQGCHNDTGLDCYCQQTSNKDIYDLIFNINLYADDSEGKVRATMLIYNQDKISSQDISLPRIFNLNSIKASLSLEVDDQRVDTTNCSVSVSSNEVKLRYNVKSTPHLPNQLFAAYMNKIQNFSEQTDNVLVLEKIHTRNKSTLVFTWTACNTDLMTFLCEINEEYISSDSSSSDSSSSDSRTSPFLIVICICIPVLILLSSILCNRCNKRPRKASNNVKLHKVIYKDYVHNARIKKDSISRECTRLSVNVVELNREEPVASTLLSGLENVERNINLFLIGNPGKGKSSIAETLLNPNSGREIYKVNCSTVAKARFNGRLLTIMECPGINYEMLDQFEMDKLKDVIDDVADIFEEEFYVYVLVFRFDTMMAVKNLKTLINLKRTFGENIIRDFCIVLLTHGNTFNKSTDDDLLFQECLNSSDIWHQFFEECDMRVILFDNVTQDDSKISTQLQKLINMADQLHSGTSVYSRISYNVAKRKRKKYLFNNDEICIQKPLLDTHVIIQ